MALYGTRKEECLLEENFKHSEMSATLWGINGAISPIGSG
jgi:hypothetical protein